MTEIFATGIQMGESPRWHDGRFWMCDWLAGQVLAFDASGNREVVARVAGLPFSIDWLPDGELVTTTPDGVAVGADIGALWRHRAAVQRDRRRQRRPGLGEHARLARRARSPKPGFVAVVPVRREQPPRRRGRVVPERDGGPRRRHAGAGRAARRPVAAWTITDSGEWSTDASGPNSDPVPPDGLCADAEGAIWYASVPVQRCARVAEGGEVLATIDVDRGCFACMLGGDDGRTLYIVANRYDGGSGASDGIVLTQAGRCRPLRSALTLRPPWRTPRQTLMADGPIGPDEEKEQDSPAPERRDRGALICAGTSAG